MVKGVIRGVVKGVIRGVVKGVTWLPGILFANSTTC